MAKQKKTNNVITENRRASHDYFLSDFLAAGIVLKGTEIKSLRHSGASLKDTYIVFRNGEAFIEGLYIAPYAFGNIFNHEPRRTRKLLMHKREIARYSANVQIASMTCVATKMYFVRGRVKLTIALGKGKKLHDKRDAIREREDKLAMAKALKQERSSRDD